MYLSHFHLHEKPFKISTDPRFFWLGERHKEAVETLRYGILYNDGYVVITGDVGLGKTTLASALVDDVSDKVVVAKVLYPDVDPLDFFKLIAAAYGLNDSFESKRSFLLHFESFLRTSSSAGKKIVLVIDEAQRLGHEHLEDLLYLSNIEENGAKLLNIVFVGQNEFNDVLLEEPNKALRQRVVINYNLSALTQDETRQYIQYRLNVAQSEREIFTPEAIQKIFSFSEGNPRLINIICDLALLVTYFEGGEMVRAETVKQCAERLRLPNERNEISRAATHRSEVLGGNVLEQISEEGPDKVGGRIVRENRRKGIRVRATLAIAFILVIALLGVTTLFYRNGSVQQSSSLNTSKKQVILKSGRTDKEINTLPNQGMGAVAPTAAKEPDVLPSVGQRSESLLQEKAANGLERIGKSGGAVFQSKKTEVQKARDSGTSVGRDKRAPSESFQKNDPNEKSLDDKKSTKKEIMGQSPGFLNKGSDKESSTTDTEEVEPSKAIDWLLEKRSDKK